MPALPSVTNTVARINFITGAAYQIAGLEAGANPTWNILGTVSNLASFTVDKFVLFTGLRTQFKVTFATTATAI